MNLEIGGGERRKRVTEHDVFVEREDVVPRVAPAHLSHASAAAERCVRGGSNSGVRRPAVRQSNDVVTRARERGQLVDAAGELDAASVKERHPIGEPTDLLQSLRRPDDSGPLGAGKPDEIPHAFCSLRVEVMRRLVDQQHRRVRK